MIVNPRLSRARFDREVKPLVLAEAALAAFGKKVVRYDYPILEIDLLWDAEGRSLILHVEAEDYDYLPVRGWWIAPGGEPLLTGSRLLPSGHGFQVNPNPYGESRSWFCFRGWREYHDHQG